MEPVPTIRRACAIRFREDGIMVGAERKGRSLAHLLGVTAVCLTLLPAAFARAADIDDITAAIGAMGAEWTAEENPVSALPDEERRSRLGAVPESDPTAKADESFYTETVPLPSSFSWTSYQGRNFVTAVRDQGRCGSCWAFASTAALEAKALITTNRPGAVLNLSEQEVLSCSGGGNCQDGGSVDIASNFLRSTGINAEGCYPYTATNGNCGNACSSWPEKAYRISGWSYVVANATASATVIKNAIYTSGPVQAQMAIFKDFYYYRSGVYTHVSGALEGYHVVLIVGWNDALGAFIVKNSWGTGWGESGYFKISYSELAGTTGFGRFAWAYGDAVLPVNLLAPNGGEVIPSGSKSLIHWSANPNAVNFKLQYTLNKGQTWSPVTAGFVTGTSYEWTVPAPQKNSPKSMVRVTGYDASGLKLGADSSNSPFTVEVLKLTSPNGAEVWQSGTPQNITWTTHATKKPVARVKLSYSTDGGRIWVPITTLQGGDPLTHAWTIPPISAPKTACRVKVVLLDSRNAVIGGDKSDAVFTIQP
jgi:C1A family cysteine protease